MENIIAKLLGDFENGKMSRRQLIQSLALAATATSTASAAVEPSRQAGGFKTISLDHISYSVADYAKTRDFYSDLMGMTVAGDNGTNQCQLQFGDSLVIARNPSTGSGTGRSRTEYRSHLLQDRKLGHRQGPGGIGEPRSGTQSGPGTRWQLCQFPRQRSGRI